jgi:predicted Zn-dependent protease
MVLRPLETALDRARAAGASYADARSLQQADEGLTVRNGQVEQARSGVSCGLATEIARASGAARKREVRLAPATRANTQSTGHAVPGGGMPGGYPRHLAMGAGASSIEEMVAGTERGIYVPRFNYANPVHPMKTIFTGMTKDGTFLIENGRITRPLRNLRFTDSILDGLFASITAVSRDTGLLPTGNGMSIYRAPAIRARLQITGSTV